MEHPKHHPSHQLIDSKEKTDVHVLTENALKKGWRKDWQRSATIKMTAIHKKKRK